MIEYHSGATRPHLLVDDQGMTVLRNQFGPTARTGERVAVFTDRPGWTGLDIYIDRCPCEVTS